jgi:Protein of unknown function (DUF3617)
MRNAILLGAAFLAVPTLLAGADKTPLNVKTGLWQVTVNRSGSGQLGIPPDVAARLTPEQRAAMESAMKNRAAAPSQPKAYEKCLTKDNLSKDPFSEKKDCTENVIKSTGSDLQVHETCTNERGKTDADLNFHATDSEHVKGTGHVVSTVGGHNMTVEMNFDSKWVSATCPAGSKND